MPGHGGYELGVGLVAGEAELLDVGVLGAEHVPGTEAEELQDVADLGLGQRILDVVAVAVLDALLVQQGDRLAAGASGTGADEVDHGGSSDVSFVLRASAPKSYHPHHRGRFEVPGSGNFLH